MPLIDSILTDFNLITMNTELICTDLATEETLPLRLVYQLSFDYDHQVSVLAPLGTALLGMRLHETTTYIDREGSTRQVYINDIISHHQQDDSEEASCTRQGLVYLLKRSEPDRSLP